MKSIPLPYVPKCRTGSDSNIGQGSKFVHGIIRIGDETNRVNIPLPYISVCRTKMVSNVGQGSNF